MTRHIRRFYLAPVKIARGGSQFTVSNHQQLLSRPRKTGDRALPPSGCRLSSGTEIVRETEAMKTLTVAVAMLALIALPAHAQMGGKRHQGDEKKTDAPVKKVDEKAYKAALERIPEPKEKYDPWGIARPAEPAKKPK
jgi:hypothetical protein